MSLVITARLPVGARTANWIMYVPFHRIPGWFKPVHLPVKPHIICWCQLCGRQGDGYCPREILKCSELIRQLSRHGLLSAVYHLFYLSQP